MTTRVVLITGVAGGIGDATAGVFQDNGWLVIGVDRQPSPVNAGHVDHYICTDISHQEAIGEIFFQLDQFTDRLDALVNNAAIQMVKPLISTPVEDWDLTMAVNVRAAYLAMRHAHPLLAQSTGSVVNVASVHALATSPGMAAYVASKGALTALTRAAALEWAADGIRVNAVLPGAVDTSMLRDGLNRGHVGGATAGHKLKMLGAKHPLGRIGDPVDIGRMILALADNRFSAFLTGQSIVIDGGASVRLSTE